MDIVLQRLVHRAARLSAADGAAVLSLIEPDGMAGPQGARWPAAMGSLAAIGHLFQAPPQGPAR